MLGFNGFPKSISTSVNNVACHGLPDERPLEDGDIVSVDVTVYKNGFHGVCPRWIANKGSHQNRHVFLKERTYISLLTTNNNSICF